MYRQRIMILDGQTRSALAIVRGFGKKGFEVIVGSADKNARAAFSKYCAQSFVYPARGDMDTIHAVLIENVRRFKPEVIMPIFSQTVMPVITNRSEYEKYSRVIPLADAGKYRQFDDKEKCMRFALSSGIDIPETYFVKTRQELEALASEIKYPVLVKPRISAGGFGIRIASGRDKLWEAYEQVSKAGYAQAAQEPVDCSMPIIQEFVQGDQVTAQAFAEKGRLQAVFCAKSMRRHPAPFGPSVAYQAVKNRQIEQIVKRIVRITGWHGPLICAFVIDDRKKQAKLIEINPRLGGTVESAVSAGVDIPFMLYQSAMGKPYLPRTDYAPGARFRWFLFGEVFYFFKQCRGIKALREFFDFRNSRCEVSIADYKPHIAHLKNLLRNCQEVR